MAKIIQYLEEFKPIAADWFRDQAYVQANYDFFQNFFQRENLEQAEWPYFQSMKPHMHCFATMAIAGSNALGNPNHSIAHYRASFLHLKYGDAPHEDRIRNFSKNEDYALKYFGDSAVSEIVGYSFPEHYNFLNSRVEFALDFLKIDSDFKHGDDLAAKLTKLSEALNPIREQYERIVGKQTSLPLNIELDQFFSWLYENYSSECNLLPKIFKYRQEANWAFELLETTLKRLGATGPDDRRIALTLRYGDKTLRLNFGSWLIMDFQSSSSNGSTVSLDLLSDGFKPEWATKETTITSMESKPFAHDGPEIRYYWEVAEIGEPLPQDMAELFDKTCRVIGERFKNWQGSPARRANQQEILEAVFHPEKRDELISHGIKKTSQSQGYWLIAAGEDAFMWDNWQLESFISIGWDEVGDLSVYGSKQELQQALQDTYPEALSSQKNNTAACYDFCYTMEPDDIVYVKQGTQKLVGCGVIEGNYSYDTGRTHHRNIRKVRWQNTIASASHAKLPIKTLTDITDNEEMITMIEDALNESEIAPLYTAEACASDLLVNIAEVKRWVRNIERKGQAVFYGPPGTGKTYVAEKLARHLISETDGFIELIQFHPSYAYEDFIQGIRPQTDGGNLTYPMVPGRFLEFCEKAKSRQKTCVLIIDEINRANLSRVFGELMYLLEYRGHSIPLGGGTTFAIPENVRIVGTMNTADRSIALVDHALRRRFSFIAIYPNYELLTNYHNKTGGFRADKLVAILQDLNSRIGDRNYEIGMSFFLRDDLQDVLPDIWQTEIEPYLDEYFFDQPDTVDKLRWAEVQKRLGN